MASAFGRSMGVTGGDRLGILLVTLLGFVAEERPHIQRQVLEFELRQRSLCQCRRCLLS